MTPCPPQTGADSMWKEFKAFLFKQNVFALAIAVVMGAATNDVVQAIVEHLIMPLVGIFLPADIDWTQLAFTIGSSTFTYGMVISALIHLLIVGIVVWQISKLLIREEPAPEGFSEEQGHGANGRPVRRIYYKGGRKRCPAWLPHRDIKQRSRRCGAVHCCIRDISGCAGHNCKPFGCPVEGRIIPCSRNCFAHRNPACSELHCFRVTTDHRQSSRF